MMTMSETTVLKRMLLLFTVGAVLYIAKAFLVPLCYGIILATLFLPLCKWLEGKKVARWLAVLICFLILILFLAGFIIALGWQVGQVANDFGLVKQKVIETLQVFQNYLFNKFGITSAQQGHLLNVDDPVYANLLQSLAGSVSTVFLHLVLILAYVIFLLYYRDHIKQFFIKITAPAQQEEMTEVLNKATHISQQYLVGLSKMILCLWIMYGVGFSILGVKNALFFAILCGVLEIIPFVGNFVGSMLTVMIAAINEASAYMLIGIIITYAVIQFIQSWFLEPLVLGPQVKINPFFTIVALVIGQLLWGVSGIILAIPLTGVFKIICDHIEQLKPYGFLIGKINHKQTITTKL